MRAYTKRLKKAWLRIRIQWVRTKRWWWRNDRHYGFWWRAGNVGAAALFLLAVAIPVLQQIALNNSYTLSAEALQLVGHTDPTLAKQLTFNSQNGTFQFNKAAVKDDSGANSLAAMQAQVGTASGKGKDKSLYALDVPTDFSKGVTYHDVNTGLSFGMIPNFSASPGKLVDGHLVFPLAGDVQGVYTLKNNGLKEDIVVQKPASDTMSFSYTFQLPKTLALKTIPNSGGNVGIYSADPTLFGNITYGNETDRANIAKARENAEKTNLVFGLPSPVVKDAKGNTVGSARFELSGNQLSVIATGLSKAHGPVTIDPSVVVTSTSDFQTGNNEDNNIDFSTSGQINRSVFSGGTVGSWTTSTNTGTSLSVGTSAGVIAYNGYLYILDGTLNSTAATAYFAPINSDGTLGAWATTSTPLVGRNYPGAAAYNGYMYLWSGYNSTSGAMSSTEYAKINSDGTLGTWQSGSTMATAVCRAGSVAYNGYLYALGGATVASGPCGNSSTSLLSSVQYAPLNADGSIGTWATTTSFTYAASGVMSPCVGAYNGYLYAVSGTLDGTTSYNGAQYAKINSDGTVGSWISATNFPTTGDYREGFVIANGYLYTAGTAAQGSTVRYVQLNANGSLGTWRTTSSLNTGRWGNGTAYYNGYVYTFGGSTAGGNVNTIEYAKIASAGSITSFTSTTPTNKFTARSAGCSVAYNGFLYILGGSTNDSNGDVSTNYVTTIGSDGSIGNWSTVNALAVTLDFTGCTAYNGYLYVVGGQNGSTAQSTVRYVAINSNGTLGTWSTTTAVPATVYFAGVFVYQNNLYVIGGKNGTANGRTYHAPINSNGTITSGTWVTDTNSIANANPLASAVTLVGNYVYYIGGTDLGTTMYKDVQYAAIDSSGNIGTWTDVSTGSGALPTAIGFTQATTVNGCIYVMGGELSGGTSVNSVYMGCPASNGAISSWVTAPNLVTATTDGAATSYNGFIYYVGGYSTSVQQYTQYAYVNNGGSGGTVGSWATTNSFTTTRYGHATVAYNGYLYIMGGHTSSGTYASDVQYAPINSNGTVGTWQTTNSSFTNNARADFSAVAYNGYLYVMGGVNGTTIYNDVEYAPINSDGTLGTWGSGGTITGRYGFAGTVYKGYLYAMGGCTSINLGACNAITNDVQYAALSSNGSVGSWGSTTGFTTSRYGLTAQAYGGYMYVIGGCTNYSLNACNTAANDVQSAPINSNGTVGTWVVTSGFHTPRYLATSTIYNGFIYIFGGRDGSGTLFSDVQYAPINSGGAVGTWSIYGSFSTARFSSASTAYSGYLYVDGGCAVTSTNCGSSLQNDVQYVGLNTIARVSHYSKLIDLGAATNVTSLTYTGNLPGGSAAMKVRIAGSNGVLAAAVKADSISGSSSCTGSATNTRYVVVQITLDDSYGQGPGGTFIDANSTPANLTDFTVNYNPVHPAPTIRLRHGQTLQAGNLSALDTCYP